MEKFENKIGDVIDDYSLFFPIAKTNDMEQWLCVDRNAKFVLMNFSGEANDIVCYIDDPHYYLSHQRHQMYEIHKYLPKKLYRSDFVRLVSKYNGIYHPSTSLKDDYKAFWIESQYKHMYICYGRLLELVNNSNDVFVNEGYITVRNRTREEQYY